MKTKIEEFVLDIYHWSPSKKVGSDMKSNKKKLLNKS